LRSRTASGKRIAFSRFLSARLPEMRITVNVFRHIGDILSSFTSRTVQIFTETRSGGVLRVYPLSAYHFWRFATPRGLSERFWDILRLDFDKTSTNVPYFSYSQETLARGALKATEMAFRAKIGVRGFHRH
jgi:hypothetical protein